MRLPDVQSRARYTCPALLGASCFRATRFVPFAPLQPPAVIPLNAAFSPRRLLVSKTYKTTTNQSETVAVRRTVARVSGPNDFFPRLMNLLVIC